MLKERCPRAGLCILPALPPEWLLRMSLDVLKCSNAQALKLDVRSSEQFRGKWQQEPVLMIGSSRAAAEI